MAIVLPRLLVTAGPVPLWKAQPSVLPPSAPGSALDYRSSHVWAHSSRGDSIVQ